MLTTTRFFTLWSSTAGQGVQIPYRTISLHARQQNALYLQLCLSDIAQTADDDLETVELLLTPEPAADSSPTEAAEKLFTTVSDCADLHPDPDEDDDQEQEQEPEPGTGGWITSENLQDFMDENGEFRMPENGSLGAGAGTVRTADQFEDADDGDEVDGEDATDATKWRRTS
jgi:nucleotide-sensitive chloride channel 1A